MVFSSDHEQLVEMCHPVVTLSEGREVAQIHRKGCPRRRHWKRVSYECCAVPGRSAIDEHFGQRGATDDASCLHVVVWE